VGHWFCPDFWAPVAGQHLTCNSRCHGDQGAPAGPSVARAELGVYTMTKAAAKH